MLILGIETSCDDTAIAVVNFENDAPTVLANIVSSQINTHAPYGGVVPNLAAREHEKNLPIVLNQALHAARYTLHDIDLIAVTSGPGLIMSLVKGIDFAKKIAQKSNKPLIGVNHIEGHIYSNWLRPSVSEEVLRSADRMYSALCLIVSGGHTELVLMKNHGEFELVGRTVDDAAGEAFDKIARLIGLEYPGGPAISREADRYTLHDSRYTLPRPMMYSKDLDFSFSGLKTSVYYLVRDLIKSGELSPEQVSAIAHEAQEAIVDVLMHKTKKAIDQFQPASLLLAGGVSANKLLREKIKALHENVFIPPMEYTTDNAAMIALAGYYATRYKLHDTRIDANANWEIA